MRAVIAISVAIMRLLFFDSSVIISHLGKKPVSGGSPPMDNRVRAKSGSMAGNLFHSSEMDLIDEKVCEWKIRNVADVSRI